MPFRIYRAQDPFLPRFGRLSYDIPGTGGRFRFFPRLKRCGVPTYYTAVLCSSWSERLFGRASEPLRQGAAPYVPGHVPVVDCFSAYFPALTSCLCCCYFYLKPGIDVVDSLGVHHANCGRITYGPDHAAMNLRGTRMDRVRVLVGVPQDDVDQYRNDLQVLTDAGVADDHIHLYVSGKMTDFCVDFEGNFGEG